MTKTEMKSISKSKLLTIQHLNAGMIMTLREGKFTIRIRLAESHGMNMMRAEIKFI